jgi:hypothetical protein
MQRRIMQSYNATAWRDGRRPAPGCLRGFAVPVRTPWELSAAGSAQRQRCVHHNRYFFANLDEKIDMETVQSIL